MKRILVYSHDTFGLGNIRRMLEVARHLVEASQDVQVLVITGSPMLHAFRIPARIDYLKLPCLCRNVDGQYAARSLDMSLQATVRLRANLITSALADFAPDLVVVDKKPYGVEDELRGALAAMATRPAGRRRPKLALLLRDILDSPERTQPVWQRKGYFDAVAQAYDAVLVVGSPEVFDLRREYAFPPAAAAKLQYCGYIARQPGRRSRAEQRQALGVVGAAPLLLVTPGGGEDGHALVHTLLQALAQLGEAERPRSHIVLGPEMAEAPRRALTEAAVALGGVTVQDFCDDMMSLHGAADLVLAMGGYNTVCELLSAGRRAVLVPRVRPGQEQLLRAERMAALGLLRWLHPETLNAGTLAQALQAELALHARQPLGVCGERSVPLPPLPRMQGLANTTRALLGLMGLDSGHGVQGTAAPAAAIQGAVPEPAAQAVHGPTVRRTGAGGLRAFGSLGLALLQAGA